jgi:ribonuclease HII
VRTFYQTKVLEAGCDEAGRGCLAGPVVAAAVILPKRFRHPLLNDSKQMTETNRNALRIIIEQKALAWAVGFVWQNEIDEINILNASFLAMHRALDQLKTLPELLLIDGNCFKKYQSIPHECIVKGDSKFASIAAASVLAKTYRDEYMEVEHLKHPHYQWSNNKGYPTKAHRDAILLHGDCELHRKTFRLLPLPKQGELFEKE